MKEMQGKERATWEEEVQKIAQNGLNWIERNLLYIWTHTKGRYGSDTGQIPSPRTVIDFHKEKTKSDK